jgi:general secretion pathway protein G
MVLCIRTGNLGRDALEELFMQYAKKDVEYKQAANADGKPIGARDGKTGKLKTAEGRDIFGLAGFTLLELVIAMTIMVTLASMSVIGYQKVQQKTKETLLKDDLKSMRKIIDQYGADKEGLPQSLDDLVSGGYIREVPIDPITGQADWDVTMGEDTLAHEAGKQGITDIHSKASGVASDGKAFSEF